MIHRIFKVISRIFKVVLPSFKVISFFAELLGLKVTCTGIRSVWKTNQSDNTLNVMSGLITQMIFSIDFNFKPVNFLFQIKVIRKYARIVN